MDINSIPLVMQYNKRDLPDLYTVEEMEQKLNKLKSPYFEAVAVTGKASSLPSRSSRRWCLKA